MNKALFNDVLGYCRSYHNRYGYFPTIREICKGLEIQSTSTISSYLNKLEQKGFIETSHRESPRAYRFGDARVRKGYRRYSKATEEEIAERIAVQKRINLNYENADALDKEIDEICTADEHTILLKLIKSKSDSDRCEILKNLEFYGNPAVLKIFDELEAEVK